MRDHEYSIVGHSRASIGRYLGAVAAVVVSALTTAGIGISNVFGSLGFPVWAQGAFVVPISAGLTYWLVHFAFNRYGWRALTWFSQVPDINGNWVCKGQTIGDDGAVKFDWTGTITISQNWEKIRVNLKTATSGSNSIIAALVPEPDKSWTLFYSYLNEPKIGEAELQRHSGYAELQFNPSMTSAEGGYFNGRGRGTHGRMQLTRRNARG
jgi:hypothetical protein